MIEQGIVVFLEKPDLEDWRELQAELGAIELRPEAWSAAEITRLKLRELVMEARFYDKYRLTASSEYTFDPRTGAVTEEPLFEIALEDEG